MLAASRLLLALLSASTTLAHPAPLPNVDPGAAPAPFTTTAILALAPSTATCSSSTQYANECRTAAEAQPYLLASFSNFNISTFPTQAALLSLILYETSNLKYSTNHDPGVPGQGTRNMQGPAYNLKYAQWLATQCADCGIDGAAVAKAEAAGPEEVLAIVNGDVWGFASAAWFVRTQCGATVVAGLDRGDEEGRGAYLGCVGTTATEGRTAVWRRALAMGAW